jgi:hypothetical protein
MMNAENVSHVAREGGTCSLVHVGEIKTAYKILAGNMRRMYYLKDLGFHEG